MRADYFILIVLGYLLFVFVCSTVFAYKNLGPAAIYGAIFGFIGFWVCGYYGFKTLLNVIPYICCRNIRGDFNELGGFVIIFIAVLAFFGAIVIGFLSALLAGICGFYLGVRLHGKKEDSITH